jgi:hypothetical protein
MTVIASAMPSTRSPGRIFSARASLTNHAEPRLATGAFERAPRVRSGCFERAWTRNDGWCNWGEDDAAITRDHVSYVAVAPSCVVSAPGRHGLTDAWLVSPGRVILFQGDSIRASRLPRP